MATPKRRRKAAPAAAAPRRRRRYTHHAAPAPRRRRRLSAGLGGNSLVNMAIDVTMGFVAGKVAGNLAKQFMPVAGIAAPLVVAYLAQKQFKKPYAAAGAVAAAVAGGTQMLNIPILNDAMNDPMFPLGAGQFVNPNMITGSQPATIMLPNGEVISTMMDAPLSAQTYMDPATGNIYAMNDNGEMQAMNDYDLNDDGFND
jgi:hypothetical protein